MKRTVPTAFVAVKAIRLNGDLYAPGESIPAAIVKEQIRNVGALIDSGWIKPTTDQLGRTRRGGSRFRQPTYYSPRERAAIQVGG